MCAIRIAEAEGDYNALPDLREQAEMQRRYDELVTLDKAEDVSAVPSEPKYYFVFPFLPVFAIYFF